MTEQKQTIVIEARIAEFERAVDETFKPALRKAVAEVIGEVVENFLDQHAETFIKVEASE